MAHGEMKALGSAEAMVDRAAFFARVNGRPTVHYRICEASPLQVDKQSSIRR
jgi:hypothetical protein